MNMAMFKVLEERFWKALAIFDQGKELYLEWGIFGSFSRGDIKAGSDIDFAVVIDSGIKHLGYDIRVMAGFVTGISGEDDVVFVKKSTLENPYNYFYRELARDYRKIRSGLYVPENKWMVETMEHNIKFKECIK